MIFQKIKVTWRNIPKAKGNVTRDKLKNYGHVRDILKKLASLKQGVASQKVKIT